MRIFSLLLVPFFLLFMSNWVYPQSPATGGETDRMKKQADYSKDHESIDSIIKATYDVISGPKNQARNWERFRALFYEGARLIPTGKGSDGVFRARVDGPDGYIDRSEPFLVNNGFFEQEIARRSEVFGNIAHVFSTYEGRRSLDDEQPFLRGINSFQLFNDGTRWWVMTIYWMAESDDSPIPEQYLDKKD